MSSEVIVLKSLSGAGESPRRIIFYRVRLFDVELAKIRYKFLEEPLIFQKIKGGLLKNL